MMGDRNTGFHRSDADFTKGREIALSAAEAIARRQIGMARKVSMSNNLNGFTPELMALCRENCALFGEPPCWKLPELAQPCEIITPCGDCLDGKMLKP